MPHKSIHEAVRAGDTVAIEQMVKAGASINEVESKTKFTPLHTAACVGALEPMHWLLWHGSDPNVRTPRGWTPAHIAAIRGQDACMKTLVNNGVSINAKDVRGSTPLHLAAAHGNSFTLQVILRAGPEVESVDRQGWTAVHAAAYHGRLGCLQLLMKWSMRVDDTDNSGNTPAHLAAMEGHLPVLKFLVSGGPSATHVLAARNDQGETPKMLAQQYFKEHVVEYISHLEWERDFPEEAESLSFPAHAAAYQGDLEHLKMLIENGVVNINERDDHGATVAHKAAGQGHINILRWIIEMGANLTIQNDAGETAKDVACRYAQLAAYKILGGGDDAKEDDLGYTGLEGEDVADPPFGNTDADTLVLTEEQKKEAQGRAKKKLKELEKMLEIARENYKQLGGKLSEKEKKKLRQIREKDRKQQLTIEELQSQLEYERLRREKLEGQVDEYRREIARLNTLLHQFADYRPEEEFETMSGRPPQHRSQNRRREKPASASRKANAKPNGEPSGHPKRARSADRNGSLRMY